MRPKSVEELVELMKEANRDRRRLLPICKGSKAHLGPPVEYDEELQLWDMPKVLEVDEEEMVVRTSACISAVELQEELRKRGRRLALDPPLFRRSSIGGILSTNFYGPMAYRYMTPRDQLLSVKIVTGKGEFMKFGAPVVKDVAGYNIKRLIAGSWGTLAVLVEAYMRIYALPESVAVMATGRKSLQELRKLHVAGAAEADGVLYLRFEGVKSEVEYRLSKAGRGDVFYDREAEEKWSSVTEAEELFASNEIAKVVAPPASLPETPPGVKYLRYPLLGVMYVAGPPPAGVKAYWLKPQRKWDVENRDLMEKIKRVLDPNGVLSPGRLP
ncbi:FAD-binding oxidoreductase [Pyrobaculum aerophilum]|uniref:Glycolate oxidase subunit glcE n=2 Tax=Pyrobaculum aerophilum TaxID=13773 RepID=Q8ZXH4_PYRAE|nr:MULTISPECIES: FAD-binding oxidoreductase [Pyrobaculum]AAL63374.1 glycolate oxidase subunit glcE [Pyrobaculum aerophilum str. IM2]MCX8136324.1 FAD-binding oxidoreductase [Pyrobaculum aerophilum]HII47687.1 FAD-binding oxidoreductase [Pyrobaculum aerophilum]